MTYLELSFGDPSYLKSFLHVSEIMVGGLVTEYATKARTRFMVSRFIGRAIVVVVVVVIVTVF